jgi:hypothetical protein
VAAVGSGYSQNIHSIMTTTIKCVKSRNINTSGCGSALPPNPIWSAKIRPPTPFLRGLDVQGLHSGVVRIQTNGSLSARARRSALSRRAE